MTARPALDERDPAPDKPWEEASSPGIRRMAREQVAAAVRAAKEARQAQYGEAS